MAKRKVAPSGDQNEMDLEQIDVELRNPSVVCARPPRRRHRPRRSINSPASAANAYQRYFARRSLPGSRREPRKPNLSIGRRTSTRSWLSAATRPDRGTWTTGNARSNLVYRKRPGDLVGRRTTALVNRLGATARCGSPTSNPDLKCVRTGAFRRGPEGRRTGRCTIVRAPEGTAGRSGDPMSVHDPKVCGRFGRHRTGDVAV